MRRLTPNGPLLTLIIEPGGELTPRSALTHFHPIMKKHGFGHFRTEDEHAYSAIRDGSVLWGDKFVFAETEDEKILINLETAKPYIFGSKKEQTELSIMAKDFEKALDCITTVEGPYFGSVIRSNLVYSAFPILLGTLLGALISRTVFDFDITRMHGLLFWIIIIGFGGKTRFWLNQRRKERPIRVGVAIFFLVPLVLIVGFAVADYLFRLN